MIPPAESSGYVRSSSTSCASSFSMSSTSSSRRSSGRSCRRSAASSGSISSRMSAARSSGRSLTIAACISGSTSAMVSAAVSRSSCWKTATRSSAVISSTMSAMSAGWSSASFPCGTVRRTGAPVVSRRSTRCQGMIPRGSRRPASPATRSATLSAPTLRRRPRRPTSAPTRRSWPSCSASCRSFTRTTLAPWVSTICLSRRSRARRSASGGRFASAVFSRRARRRKCPISCARSAQRTTFSPFGVARIAHCAAGNCPCGTTAMSASLPTSLPFGSMTLRCCISDRYGIGRKRTRRRFEGAEPLRPLQFVHPRAPQPGVPSCAGGRSVPPTSEASLRARAVADQAIVAALEADWPRAAELNQKIVEASPDDVEGRNRLGRAYIELGRLEEAKAAFAEVLRIEPHNSIALRNQGRVAALLEHKGKPNPTTTKTQPRLFIEDMGKTGILRIINPAPTHVLAKYSPGAECELREQEGLLAVHARDGELVGFLEPKVGRRLIDLLRTGNQYVAALVSSDPQNPRIAIREMSQSAENASRISFPGHHRPAETKERAYVRGTFFRYGSADEEGEVEEVEEAETVEPTGEEVLEDAESTDEPLAVETEDDDDDTEDEAEE